MKKYQHIVQYYETDQMGIVHHSNYIRWFEEARSYLLEKIGFGYKKMEEMGIISPVLSVKADFKTMTKYYDTVEIDVNVLKYNGIKIVINYEITDLKTGVVRCSGQSEHCFLNREGKPVSLKKEQPELNEILSSLVSSENN